MSFSYSGYTQSSNRNNFLIDNLDISDGILSNFVTKTISDENNFKYFATEGGVSYYDGYEFKGYRPSSRYPNLESENIETLFKDKENLIWIGTKGGGLSMLNPTKNEIVNFNEIFVTQIGKKPRIVSINQDSKGNIWIGTWSSGLFVINPKENTLERYLSFNSPVYQILCDKLGNMWFIVGKTLYKFDFLENRIINHDTDITLYNMIEDTLRKKIWLTGNKGESIELRNFDYYTQKIRSNNVSLTGRYAKSIAIDVRGRIWIGSWGNGLYISDENIERFDKVNTSPTSKVEKNVNYSFITDIFIDKNNIGWLSTAYGGVLILHPNKGFDWLQDNDEQQGYDKNIIAIFEDSKKNLYKGTLTEGLYVKKPASKTFEKIKQIPNVKVNVIYEKFNMFFVGTSQGLFVTNDNNFNRIKHYFPNEKITTILLDSKQRLWIGTQERGLYLVNDFDELIKEVEVFSETHPNNALDNNRISKIIEDATGNIWLGTYAGLNKYDEVNKKIISQDKLLVDFIKKSIINDIFIDKDKIYLATPQGLIILIFDKLKKRLDVEKRDYSGISDNFLCAIQKDNEGSIWLSSSNTLIKYDTESKNSIIFSRVDGVLINSFHIASSFKDLNGHLYFGGSNGLIKFDPKNINTTTTVPDVIFTKILVNNKEVDINEEVNGNLILENSLVKTNEISLKHFQNNINLRFAVNDLLGADQIKYQYSLSKRNDNWIELGTRNEVNFTNLQSGKYSVSIRASRNNLDWSSVATMSFTIATPPWLSWYAIFIYGLIFLGFIAIFNFLYLRQEKLKGQLELVRIEKEKEHELNEAKLIFFTNISHEFKTPLTLILSPVIELLNSHKLQRDVKDRVTIIEKNARKMLRLINQLIDFRKSEHGILTLNIKVNNLIELIQRIYNDFKPMAKEKNIQMSLSIDCNHCEYHYDEMQLEIVLNNLLSNALKYTNEGGFIAMSLTKNEAYIEINIKDTGIGISEDDKDKIFDRFYQTENSKYATDNLLPTIGSGIGLTFTKKIVELHNGFISLESKVGEGSNFKVSLPLELGYNSYHNIQDSALQESEVRHEKNKTKNDEMVTTSSDNDVKDNNEESAEISILIVDDNDGIRQYLSTLLMTTYKIIEAKDGFEALEVVNEKYPDIIVCDVMMPKMDGIQFCKRIKKNISTSHIPIILLTARTAEIYQLEGLQTGADDYITKPFNPEILKTKISNLLFNRAKIREYFQNKMRFEPNSEIIIDDSKLDQEFINKIVLHIENNIQNPELNINNLTAEFHMSRSSLFRKIKSLTGLSLTGLIKTIKLKKAAQLILQSDLKLSTIAYETGFNDYKYFKLSFKEQFSCLPSEYKSKILTK